MNAMRWMTAARRFRLMLPIVLFSVLFAGPGLAQINGTVVKKDGGRVAGAIKWQPASRQYLVAGKQVNITVKLDEVLRVEVARPPELDPAIRQVQSGSAASAIPTLQGVMGKYEMMGPDVEAARWLGEAYMLMKDPTKALQMYETVLQSVPNAALDGEFAGGYWNALLAKGLDTKLQRELSTAIEQGSRSVAAVALVKRGDLADKAGNLKDALVDGYLRTVIMFRDVKAIQPEALYKAIKCFQKLNQQTHAENLRKRLLKDYSDSSWAQKLQAGT